VSVRRGGQQAGGAVEGVGQGAGARGGGVGRRRRWRRGLGHERRRRRRHAPRHGRQVGVVGLALPLRRLGATLHRDPDLGISAKNKNTYNRFSFFVGGVLLLTRHTLKLGDFNARYK